MVRTHAAMAPKPAASGSAGPAGSKKPRAGTPVLNARSDNFIQRRAQVHAARSIPAQPADAALKDGELDLQAFLEAHRFEIRSLEQSMATSKSVGSSRAFQQVPRGLRRRTASHNPKRVPRRLRARAKREMKDDNTPMVETRRRKPTTTRARIRAQTARRLGILAARKRRKKLKQMEASEKTQSNEKEERPVVENKSRPKLRRNALNDPPRPLAKYRKRQLEKTWLPTHLWHAKRARMTEPKEPLWRFAVPLTPNDKVYRPTHRAQGDRGAVVWDTSYHSTIGLYGNYSGLERVLKRIGVTQETSWNEKGRKWRLGTRSWTGLLSRDRAGQLRQMGPATIFWDPESKLQESESRDPKKIQRRVLVRVHPAAFLETFNELLRLTKMENPRLYIEDLRFEIGSFEITGPASTEILLAVLRPYQMKNHPRQRHGEVFKALTSLSNPAALPANALLSFAVEDPRLKYPPRKVSASNDPEDEMKLLELMAQWPVEEELEPYAIFDRDARHKASSLPSQQSINRRKGVRTPGSLLKPTSADPPIPITLLAHRSSSGTKGQGSWTLLAPWKCILPFWYSVVHCPLTSGGNPRFGGLNESMQVAFERGLPWFPADFLGTDAGAEWELEQRRRRKRAWQRRPKSKRQEFASLDLGAGRKGELGDGLACDLEFLLGLPKEQTEQEKEGDAMEVDKEKEPDSSPKQSCPSPLTALNYMPRVSFLDLLSGTESPPPPPPHAIIHVRISLLTRGTVLPCARVYRLPRAVAPVAVSPDAEVPATIPSQLSPSGGAVLPSDLRSQWLDRVPSQGKATPASSAAGPKPPTATGIEARKRLLARELTAPPPAPSLQASRSALDQLAAPGNGHHPLVPGADDLVGFVTTGSFCLSDGRGAAIGSLAVGRIVGDVTSDPREGRLCIVRNAGHATGWIARWEVM